MLTKVIDKQTLVRDSNTNAILNTDRGGLDQYRQIRKTRLSTQQQIDNINIEMSEIKGLLTQLIKAMDKNG